MKLHATDVSIAVAAAILSACSGAPGEDVGRTSGAITMTGTRGFAASCSSTTLSENDVLAANCLNVAGQALASTLALNSCVTNTYGTLGWEVNGGYNGSCTTCTLSGTLMTCDCANGAGKSYATTIDVSAGVNNCNGVLTCGACGGSGSPAGNDCGSTSSISSLLTQYGSGSTSSATTPMGVHFVPASQALPLSAANASFLATASDNPTVAQATVATGLEWKKVNVTLYPSGAPSPEDVMQHAIGDCDGDSALASMAYLDPDFVLSLITGNNDGTFNVQMVDPSGASITVAVDSNVLVETSSTSNIGEVTANNGSADWATVLEKAVMKYDVAYDVVGPIDGIGSEFLLPMFTGNGASIAISPGSLTAAQFQQVVEVSLAAGDFITGGFNQAIDLGLDQTVTSHGYAVMVPTNSSDMVDMRNPWGVNPWANSHTSGYDTSTDGLLQIPISTSSTNWANIIDLRIINPGASCNGATAPFVPQIKRSSAAIRISEPHAHTRD